MTFSVPSPSSRPLLGICAHFKGCGRIFYGHVGLLCLVTSATSDAIRWLDLYVRVFRGQVIVNMLFSLDCLASYYFSSCDFGGRIFPCLLGAPKTLFFFPNC